MRTLTRILATFSVLLILGGCGSSSSSGGSGSTSSSPTSAPAATDVVSVTLRQSGGLKPVTVERTFTAGGTPPTGFTASDVDQVIAAAQTLSDDPPHVQKLPFNTCCDRYRYDITVTYGDGSTKSYVTIDGLKQPPALMDLLHAVVS